MPHAHPSGFPPRAFGRSKHGEGQARALREGATFFHRSAGASDAIRASERVPPRALECADDGEGQARALREGEAFFHRSAEASDATRASERVSPATLGDL